VRIEGAVNALNNVCVAPWRWRWDGPVNLFNAANITEYAACG
jgi:hypothetical protein